jgi:hypothetical protein
VTTLDVLLAQRFPGKRMLVKIDVEGAEYKVLRGAVALLTRRPRPTWMIEICLGEYHPDGPNPHFIETFELLLNNGYEASVATGSGGYTSVTIEDARSWMAAGKSSSGAINYVFTPAGGS